MPFLGKSPTAGFASIVKDDLTPNGSTTAFTLSKQVANANDIAVFLGNVRQEPTDAYTVSGTTLTMSEAPASGLNFYVLHIAGTHESSVVPADNTISTAKIASGAVTSAKINSGAIDGSLLDTNAFMIDTWYHAGDITSSGSSFIIGSSDSSDFTNQTTNTNRGSSRMSESAGIFTFPSTGIYKINYFLSVEADGGDTNIRADIAVTTNNSSYTDTVRQHLFHTAVNQFASAQMSYVFDVTNTTTHKVRFTADSSTGATIKGGQNPMSTYVIFEKLGDT